MNTKNQGQTSNFDPKNFFKALDSVINVKKNEDKDTPSNIFIKRGASALTRREIYRIFEVVRSYYIQVDSVLSNLDFYHYYRSIRSKLQAYEFVLKSIGLLAKLFKTFLLLGVKLVLFPSLLAKYIDIFYNLINQLNSLAKQVVNLNLSDDQSLITFLRMSGHYILKPEDKQKLEYAFEQLENDPYKENILMEIRRSIKKEKQEISDLTEKINTYLIELKSSYSKKDSITLQYPAEPIGYFFDDYEEAKLQRREDKKEKEDAAKSLKDFADLLKKKSNK